MTSFFINLWRLLVATRHGIKDDPEFRALLILLLTLLAGATYFYWQVEGWSVIDSLYFSIMTMSTIGYGDFVPTTTFSKVLKQKQSSKQKRQQHKIQKSKQGSAE